MEIKLKYSFKSLIYSLLIKYWKGVTIFSLCVLAQILAVVFPHVFTYRLGRNVFVAIALVALSFDYLSHLPLLSERIKVRFYLFFEKYFLLILLSAISLFSIGALNEKLFDNDPAKHSIYQGFTIGGIIPSYDGAGYLIDMQSFLKYGVIQSSAVYRPIATLLAAIFYKCCGEDIIAYFYLTTMLLIFAIFWLGTVIARLFNKGLATIVSYCLCFYFALFQGSFLTEMTGGIIGIIAFAAILNGLFRKNIVEFCAGILLIGLALQIRAGAMFILPLLVFYGAVYFRKKSWVSTKILLVSTVLILLAFLTNPLQLRLYSQKFDVASNVGYIVYQIQVNSNDWNQAVLDNPKIVGLKPFDRAKLINKIAFQRLKDDPGTFLTHYLFKTWQTIKNLWLFTFHFMDVYLSMIVGNLTLILFFLTPVLYSRNSKMHVLFWFLLIGLIGAILSSPFLQVASPRSSAATISFNVMIFAVAIANGLLFLRNLYFNSSGIHLHLYYKWKLILLRSSDSVSQIWKRKEITQRLPKMVFIYIFIVLTILAGPVIIDKMRDYKPPYIDFHGPLSPESQKIFLLSVKDSPYALFYPLNDFIVYNPLIIPGTKLKNNSKIKALPNSPFYMFNAINHFNFMQNRYYSFYLVIPTFLLSGFEMENISEMLLKGEVIIEDQRKIFLTKEICNVTLNK